MAPAPTLEDLFEFLKKDKVERAQEREKDKAELKLLIQEGVKQEVSSLIKPIEDRVTNAEKAQVNLSEQFKVVSNELNNLKEQLKSRHSDDPHVHNIDHTTFKGTLSSRVNSYKNSEKNKPRLSQPEVVTDTLANTNSNELCEIISLGRRTIGLQRIDKVDLERMRQEQYGGATSEDEEKLLAVREYLKCELKIDSDTVKSMEIERIFSPFMENPTHLYVTFKQESSVSKVFEKTRIMRAGSRILYYVPIQFRYRAKAIREIEYNLRHVERFQTRIKMGLNDLELWKKVRGSRTKWEKVVLPANLPPVDLTITTNSMSDPDESDSPPPGRPGQQYRAEKRNRDSPSSDATPSKVKVSRCEINSFSAALEKANLVGDATISPVKEGGGLQKKPDSGRVYSVCGTPLKNQLAVISPESPIITSKSSKK